MSLIRMTPRKLAANRANAQKSTGPRTPAGKAASAQNNAIHYLYARKFTVPPEWHAEFTARAAELTLPFADPVERALRAQWVYLELWIKRLDTLENKLCRLEIQQAADHPRRGIANWVRHNPLFRAWLRLFRKLTRQAARLFRAIKTHCRRRRAHPAPPPPAPKAIAAGAHFSPDAVQTHISLIPNDREIYSPSPGPLLTSLHQPFWALSL